MPVHEGYQVGTAVVIALLILLAASFAVYYCTARPLKPIRAAGARLVADVEAMVAACRALAALSPGAADSCATLSRGLAAHMPGPSRALPSVEESRRLYLGLASPTAISAAAAAYAAAAAAADGPLAAALLECSQRLRQIVKSVHRLGTALDLE